MDDVSEQRGARRPTVVTVAVAIWWTVLAVRAVLVVVGIVRLDREDPALLPAGLVGAVLGIGFCALLAWGALRTARGSGTARFWLALVSAFAVLNLVIAVFCGAQLDDDRAARPRRRRGPDLPALGPPVVPEGRASAAPGRTADDRVGPADRGADHGTARERRQGLTRLPGDGPTRRTGNPSAVCGHHLT